MMNERRIGKVISVDSFRVFIKLDDDLKSLYKSGYEDIYEVARINSYIIIPIGADKIVAMVTRIKALDETELEKDKEAIFLTKSARYLVATMIGTIENGKKYIQGVYNYPVLDNPVWYVTKKDLDKIFDQSENSKINYSEDFFLPIGTSPSFSDYKIKINPDKFFGKHAAILGNTGSGKSCTLASILQSLFNFSYGGETLKNGHIIIFDTNGEYKNAFIGSQEYPYKKLEVVNPFYIDKKGLKVPYWFMNFDDFDYLFEPSANVQAPVLKRAINIAKSEKEFENKGLIPRPYIFFLEELLEECQSPNFKVKNRIYNDLELFGKEFSAVKTEFDTSNIIGILRELFPIKKDLIVKGNGFIEGPLSTEKFSDFASRLSVELIRYNLYISDKFISEDRNIDLPVWFDYKSLLQEHIDNAINELEGSNNKIREFVSTLRLRLQSFLNDDRISSPLLLGYRTEITDSLAKFLAFILGDICKVFQDADEDIFTKYCKDQNQKTNQEKLNHTKPSQITIIDMSLLPYEVLETVTGLIGRLILDFVSRFPEEQRGKLPIVIALEEAQNYIPEKNKRERESVAKRVFERIAREGRKYGLSLLISSQRPSELSKTVLSQCNSFVIHRLQNPEDQKYVRQLVSAANEDILQQLPILPQQHAIIMGDAVRTPVQVKINSADPKPNSNNPEFITNWLEEQPPGFPDYIGISDAWEKGERYFIEQADKAVTGLVYKPEPKIKADREVVSLEKIETPIETNNIA